MGGRTDAAVWQPVKGLPSVTKSCAAASCFVDSSSLAFRFPILFFAWHVLHCVDVVPAECRFWHPPCGARPGAACSQNKPGHEQQRQGSSLPVGPLPFLNFLHRGQGTALGGIRTTSLSGCNTFAVPGRQIPVESARTERERQVRAIALYCGAMGVRMRMAATKMSAPRRTTAEKQERPGHKSCNQSGAINNIDSIAVWRASRANALVGGERLAGLPGIKTRSRAMNEQSVQL